jgi:CheY-like chemotaxis protein
MSPARSCARVAKGPATCTAEVSAPRSERRLEQVDRAKAAHGVLARKRRISRFCQFLTNCRPPGHDDHMPDSPRQLKRFLLARPLQGATVLVVDDHEDSRNVLRQMVEWFGARVHTARNGLGALAWLDKQTPDLLLLDLRMPGMDGFTVFQRLRADPRFSKLRAIAVTALGSDDDVMRTWEAGFDGHLVKPIDFETLALALNRAFWAHSGQVRFSVGRMPAPGAPTSGAQQPAGAAVHIAGIVNQPGARDDFAPAAHRQARPADAARPARGPNRGFQVVPGGRGIGEVSDRATAVSRRRRHSRPGSRS